MYIDKELVDTEHLCCLAHARAKFVYAYEQGDDPDAKYLIDCFGELYRLENTYTFSTGDNQLPTLIADQGNYRAHKKQVGYVAISNTSSP